MMCVKQAIVISCCFFILWMTACSSQPQHAKTSPTTKTKTTAAPSPFEGYASWYGRDFQGKKTASGERFNMNVLTAAHRTLPFGTKVEVYYPATGKSTKVRINDRGPYTKKSKKRVIDLSYAAAKAIGLIKAGHGWVEVRVVGED